MCALLLSGCFKAVRRVWEIRLQARSSNLWCPVLRFLLLSLRFVPNRLQPTRYFCFSLSPRTHTHTYTHTHSLSLSLSRSLSFLSLCVSCLRRFVLFIPSFFPSLSSPSFVGVSIAWQLLHPLRRHSRLENFENDSWLSSDLRKMYELLASRPCPVLKAECHAR